MTDQTQVTQDSQEVLSNDDKLLSLLCHLSAAFGSIILPAIIYFIYRKKSKFVSFNALQALYYQVAFFILTLVFTFVLTIVVLASDIDVSSPMAKDLFVLGLSLLIWALELSYAAYIGVKTFKGEIIMYFIFGELAYDRIYTEGYKDSFNRGRKNKSSGAFHGSLPPEKKNGLI